MLHLSKFYWMIFPQICQISATNNSIMCEKRGNIDKKFPNPDKFPQTVSVCLHLFSSMCRWQKNELHHKLEKKENVNFATEGTILRCHQKILLWCWTVEFLCVATCLTFSFLYLMLSLVLFFVWKVESAFVLFHQEIDGWSGFFLTNLVKIEN